MSLSVIKMPNPTEPASDFDRTAHENRVAKENRETVADVFALLLLKRQGKCLFPFPKRHGRGCWRPVLRFGARYRKRPAVKA